MTSTMTRTADGNHVEPAIAFVSIVMMVVGCLLSAVDAFQGFYRRQSAFANLKVDESLRKKFLWSLLPAESMIVPNRIGTPLIGCFYLLLKFRARAVFTNRDSITVGGAKFTSCLSKILAMRFSVLFCFGFPFVRLLKATKGVPSLSTPMWLRVVRSYARPALRPFAESTAGMIAKFRERFNDSACRARFLHSHFVHLVVE